MADLLHGVATYPGLFPGSFRSADYTVSHGVSPGVATIKFAPPSDSFVADIEPIGDLTLTDGVRTIVLRDCIASGLTKNREDGYVWTMTLYDRRWRWQFGSIDGRYNERDATNKIRPEMKLTVHEMAARCFEAMSEVGYDLGDLPNPDDEDSLPTVDWNAENPAKALADLCDMFNCRIVFQPIRNRVKISSAGNGNALPDTDYSDYVPGLTKPIKPQSVEFVGGPLTFMAAVRLDPYGEDFDGSIVPIDDLSYKPVGGWGKAIPPFFDEVVLPAKWQAKGKKLADAVALARKSVYRYFKAGVGKLNGVDFQIPGLAQALPGFELKEGWQVVLLDSIYGVKRDENRNLYTDPPKVFGTHRSGELNFVNSAANAEVEGGFSVDTARGLVIFNRNIHKTNTSDVAISTGSHGNTIQPGEHGPPDIAIITSINLRDINTKQVIKFRRPRIIEKNRTSPARIVRRDDIVFVAGANIYAGTWVWDGFGWNGDEVIEAADAIMDQIDDYDRILPEQYTYPRLVDIDPDGAISQITWSVSGAVSTKASRNGEHEKWMPPYRFRRGQERIYQILEAPKEPRRDLIFGPAPIQQ